MGKENPGQRDGTGPATNSFQEEVSQAGQRESQGEPCPEK